MADALAFEVDIGLLDDAHLIELRHVQILHALLT
jgi:hypothetical protein